MIPTLLLFDIDGTLLRGAAAEHAQALYESITEVFGVSEPWTAHVDPAGRTDLDIARLILIDRGVSPERIDAGRDALRDACCERYARLCPATLEDRVIEGTSGLLEELSGRDEVALSLVTGNLEPVARLKLARARLGRFFPVGQGGFGSDGEDRAALPPVARARAGLAGRPHPRERTIVIGDTPRDIACARADGLRVIAVATGPHPAADLVGADALAHDAGELRSAIDRLARDHSD